MTAPRRRPRDPAGAPAVVPAPERPDLDLTGLPPGDPDVLGPERQVEEVELAGATTDPLDLTRARLNGVRIERAEARQWQLRGARLREVELAGFDAAVLSGPYGDWSDVVVGPGRIGVGELYESGWRRVRLVGLRARYLNLRGCVLSDVELVDCTIDELDLDGARLDRVALPRTRIGVLTISGATLAHVDLRGADLTEIVGMRHLSGAVVDDVQLARLAPALAGQLGIRVIPADGG